MPRGKRLSLGRRTSLVPEVSDNLMAADEENVTPTNSNVPFFNDDNAEKRKSREKVKRRRSLRRRSLMPSPRKKGKKAKKDPTQLKALYSAIIKMCAQNKITEQNCWNDFIDNIDDILVAEKNNGNSSSNSSHEGGTGSLNQDGIFPASSFTGTGGTDFTKASCTIDASTKIYEKRVDDTHKTSLRVLGSLSRQIRSGTANSGDGRSSKRASRKLCVANTLEQNIANITLKEACTDNYAVSRTQDPMFAQLSRVFDEGGASGMLLSVLHAQPGGQIVFDSSDVTIAGADARCRGKGNNLGYFDMTTLRRTFWDLGADTASLELCPALPKLYAVMQGKAPSFAGPDAYGANDDNLHGEKVRRPARQIDSTYDRSMQYQTEMSYNDADFGMEEFTAANDGYQDDDDDEDDDGDNGFGDEGDADMMPEMAFDNHLNGAVVGSVNDEEMIAQTNGGASWALVHLAVDGGEGTSTTSHDSTNLDDDNDNFQNHKYNGATAGSSQDYFYFDVSQAFGNHGKKTDDSWAGASHWRPFSTARQRRHKQTAQHDGKEIDGSTSKLGVGKRSRKKEGFRLDFSVAGLTRVKNDVANGAFDSPPHKNTKQEKRTTTKQRGRKKGKKKDQEMDELHDLDRNENILSRWEKWSTATTLARVSVNTNAAPNLLPRDLHIKPQALATLFTRPQVAVRMAVAVAHHTPNNEGNNTIGQGTGDGGLVFVGSRSHNALSRSFGAIDARNSEQVDQHNHDYDVDDDDDDDTYGIGDAFGEGDVMDLDMDGGDLPTKLFDTTTANCSEENGHGGGAGRIDSVYEDGFGHYQESGREELLDHGDFLARAPLSKSDVEGLVMAERTVGQLRIRFATAAKFVNVKRLKTNLWTGITQRSHQQDRQHRKKTRDLSTSIIDSEPHEKEISFRTLMTDLARHTVRDRSVTVSFFFLCVLHLANEHGLKINGDIDSSQLSELHTISDSQVNTSSSSGSGKSGTHDKDKAEGDQGKGSPPVVLGGDGDLDGLCRAMADFTISM